MYIYNIQLHLSIVYVSSLQWHVLLEYRMTDQAQEIMNGLRCYFDKALPVILLYKKERQQYSEAVVDHASPSSIYGAEHLLRLFGMLSHF